MLDSYITPISHNGFALEASYAVYRQFLWFPTITSVNLEDQSAIMVLQDYIPKTSSTVMESSINPLYIERPSATNLASPPKLKPLIIPEQGTVALGLLTPVEETPDDSEASSSKIIRPLPVPSRRNNPSRPIAQSTATQSAVSRLFPKVPTTRRDVIQIIPDLPAVVASTTIERLVGSDYEALEMFMDHQHDLPSKHTFRSDAGTVSTGRISVSKTSHQHSHHFTRSEHPSLSRARANTSVALPRHQIQNRIASPTATSSTTASSYSADINTPDTQSPKIPVTKVKALPSPPVILEKIEGNRFQVMSKDKGKGKALDFAGQSHFQNDYQGNTGHGLLTPPDSAKSSCPPVSTELALSGFRGARPRGPRTRRSTIS